MAENLVSKLRDFSELNFRFKVEVAARGRLTPDFKILLKPLA